MEYILSGCSKGGCKFIFIDMERYLEYIAE